MAAKIETFVITPTDRAQSSLLVKLRAVRGHRIRGRKKLREEFLERRGSRRASVFVCGRVQDLEPLAEVVGEQKGNLRLLLLAKDVSGPEREFLQTLFRTVVVPDEDVHLLDTDELIEAVSSDEREDLFIGGTVDRTYSVAVLYRGDLERFAVPLAWFSRKSGTDRPDFDDFEIIDYGQTVRFGPFEAAAEAILYEFDTDYRRRAKRREIALDASLGAAIRRLRLQRGLSQDDFPPLSKKEIGRIERGEVRSPRVPTLNVIAERLEVDPDELGSY